MPDSLDRYILIDRVPVIENDFLKWASYYQRSERIVAQTKLNRRVTVSTVFLGLDHNFGRGEPLLFETMVFGGGLDGECFRYSTWDAAEAGHNKTVVRALAAK